MKISWKKLIICIIICQMAGVIGSVFTTPNIATWYATLNKPSFTPPGWVFGPVWITLYTLMGIALYLVWQKGFNKKENKIALYLFGAQLALNSIWSIVFFGMHNVFWGLIIIIALWVILAATIVMFYKIRKTAGLLLIPYICWGTIATALNYYVLVLN